MSNTFVSAMMLHLCVHGDGFNEIARFYYYLLEIDHLLLCIFFFKKQTKRSVECSSKKARFPVKAGSSQVHICAGNNIWVIRQATFGTLNHLG